MGVVKPSPEKEEITKKIKEMYNTSKEFYKFMAIFAAEELTLGYIGEPYYDFHKIWRYFRNLFEKVYSYSYSFEELDWISPNDKHEIHVKSIVENICEMIERLEEEDEYLGFEEFYDKKRWRIG